MYVVGVNCYLWIWSSVCWYATSMFVQYVGSAEADAFVQSMAGIHRVDRPEFVRQRALDLVDSGSGCVVRIGSDDPCYNGVGTVMVRCNAHILSSNDRCWYHSKILLGDNFLSHPIITLESMRSFVEECEQTTAGRFFGKEVTEELKAAMNDAIAIRELRNPTSIAPPLSLESHALMYLPDDSV
jgi:hypothetical protein